MRISDILEGNRNFTTKVDKELLKRLAEKGQKPIAAVVACSDSRVPVEIIFNQLNPGALFVIRVAGNVVADSSVKGSIEYAVEHLKIPYLIVLGHTDCGAVKASLAGGNKGEVGKLVNGIKLKSQDMGQAVLENVALQVNRVIKMDCVKNAIDRGAIEVYGMIYDLITGKIEYLSKSGASFNRD